MTTPQRCSRHGSVMVKKASLFVLPRFSLIDGNIRVCPDCVAKDRAKVQIEKRRADRVFRCAQMRTITPDWFEWPVFP